MFDRSLLMRHNPAAQGHSLGGSKSRATCQAPPLHPIAVPLRALHRTCYAVILGVWDDALTSIAWHLCDRARRGLSERFVTGTHHAVTILDPAVGESRLPMAEVSRHFTGEALELTPKVAIVVSGRKEPLGWPGEHHY